MSAAPSTSNSPAKRSLRRVLAAVGALALVARSGAALADTPVSAKASRHFKEGVRYLTTEDADRFEKAYAQFRAAYADSPSWKILGNVGIVAEALERDGEAVDAYRSYLEGGAKTLSASEREQFSSDLSRIELGSASIKIKVEPDGAWLIDERAPREGKPVVNRYGPSSGTLALRLRAGRHRLHAELNGESGPIWELEALPGGSAAHEFDLRPAPIRPPTAHPEPVADRSHESDEPHGGGSAGKIVGYASLGLGAVGAGLGTYFLLRSFHRQDEGDVAYDQCLRALDLIKNEPEPRETPASCHLSDEKTNAETRENIRSGVSFGVAGALVATGVLLLIYSGNGGAPASDEAALTPWVGPRQLGISGRF